MDVIITVNRITEAESQNALDRTERFRLNQWVVCKCIVMAPTEAGLDQNLSFVDPNISENWGWLGRFSAKDE